MRKITAGQSEKLRNINAGIAGVRKNSVYIATQMPHDIMSDIRRKKPTTSFENYRMMVSNRKWESHGADLP